MRTQLSVLVSLGLVPSPRAPQYGHAVGHAIEHLSWSGEPHVALLHGEAVAIGMCVTAEVSLILGHCDIECVNDHYDYVSGAGLPVAVPATMDVDAILEVLRYDKHFVDMPTMGLCSRVGEMVMSGPDTYAFKIPMGVVAKAIQANTRRAATA